MKKNEIKVAIIDLYNNERNEGMRCIKEIVSDADKLYGPKVSMDVYETRYKDVIPNLDYDIFISSGGPGSPFEGEGSSWEKKYFGILEKIWENNQKKDLQKKHVFFICHSFQMMARFFKFGEVTERDYKSFGVMPIQKTAEGEVDPLLKNLSNPYYAADIRRFQVLNPNKKVIDELGAEVLSVEIVPPNESHPPAIMAMRVSNEISGTQYHPEADPESMLYHFMKEEEKQQIIATYGEERYNQMIEHLRDPDKIRLTRKTILPTFLRESIKSLTLN